MIIFDEDKNFAYVMGDGDCLDIQPDGDGLAWIFVNDRHRFGPWEYKIAVGKFRLILETYANNHVICYL